MNLKNKLLEIKEDILTKFSTNKDFEFDAIFENHPIGNQKIYRLYYVDYHRIGQGYGMKNNNIGIINWSFEPFMFPNGMTREEGFKVLSYFTDVIEKREDIDVGSFKSVKTLDENIDLGRIGFTRVKGNDEDKILNLFTVSGRVLLFKKSDLYQKYFEWYSENVTKDEVKEIYAKYNMEFKDILFPEDKKVYTKTLKKDNK